MELYNNAHLERDAKWISLHDACVTDILIKDKEVAFVFDKGFDLINNQQVEHLEKGSIIFEGTCEDDITFE